MQIVSRDNLYEVQSLLSDKKNQNKKQQKTINLSTVENCPENGKDKVQLLQDDNLTINRRI